jgi:hypothetical protein
MALTLTTQRRGLARVNQHRLVDPLLAFRFLTLYRGAFAPLEARAPARQALTDDEFLAQMEDRSVVKFVAWNMDEQPVALAFMATDLATVPWISPPYFRARYPEHFARGAIYYFGALLVSPEHQRGPWASMVLRAAAQFVADARAVAVFDCCDYNVGRGLLAMITRAAGTSGRPRTEELEAQRYFAFDYADQPAD